MRYIVACFVIATTLVGCGGDENKFLEDTAYEDEKAPQQIQQSVKEDTYIDEEEDSWEDEDESKESIAQEKQVKMDKIFPSNDGSFSAIKNLIQSSQNGVIDDVTYICVGDSTRADSKYNGVYVFKDVRERLYDFGVNSYLHAKAGHTAREFNSDGASPTWRDVVDDIPGDGRDCIVDISLGINDSWGGGGSFEYHLKSAISKIKSYKPNTHFMLTMPDRVYGDSDMTNKIKWQYQDLSSQLQIPLVNVVEDIMPSQESTSYSLYRHDGFNVHLSREGQRRVANDILSHILPD